MSFYVTTPIFYVNAQPHLGHAYTTIVADTAARFHRLNGEETRFQTGTDEHGDKIAEAAAKAGETPQEYADRISALFRNAWPDLDIAPDNFIRTTDPAHKRIVQAILQQVYEQGDIYFSEYEGLYCKGCERFVTEKELVDGLCPDHQKEPERIREQNYFFRMSKYQEWLIDHIKQHPDCVTPERYRNEVLSFLKEPLEDLCISRPTSRLTWGIPLPFDEKFVTYVWFDALINYISGLGYPNDPLFARYWPAAEHIIAKDILKPHAIYWPTMLRAIGVPMYRKLHVHGYWNVNEAKMSKSLGNVVRPGELAAKYGADAVRYFLLREMSFGVDASFSEEALLGRQNADLANDLGNLFARSLAMLKKFAKGVIPAPAADAESPEDNELREAALAMLDEYSRQMEAFAFNRALQAVWEVVSRANKYIVTSEPWVLAKDPAKAPRLHTMLYHLAETLRCIAVTLQPVMPSAAAKMLQALGLTPPCRLADHRCWQVLPPGSELHDPGPLFPRLDKKAMMAADPPAAEAAGRKGREKSASAPTMDQPASSELIDFNLFQKLDLRVAEIIAAEPIPKAKRLLRLTVRAPEERTVVAGIAEHYQPEDLVGRQVILVANLKPAKLMGVVSEGMVLAAKEGNRLTLLGPDTNVAAGTPVS